MQEKQKKLQEESRADQEYIKKWQVFLFLYFFLLVRQRGRGRESGGREKGCVWGGGGPLHHIGLRCVAVSANYHLLTASKAREAGL
jgi:hypothetical protein